MRLFTLAQGFTISGGDRDITCVTEDSRKVVPGALFVAITGSADDGHAYIDDAIRRGAVAVAGERLGRLAPAISTINLPDSRAALAVVASRFYGNPARDLRLIGFTGTFGKTSTSDVLRALLAAGGARPGVLGSLGAKYGAYHDAGDGLTTPAPVELHRALRGLHAAGADTAIMEVTSHALRMRRIDGLEFDGGLLAAIEPGEHTDFHRTYDDYVQAKRLFLDHLSAGAILAYDADNPAATTLAASRAAGTSVGFSLQGAAADLVFTDISLDADGARFSLDGPLLRRSRFPSNSGFRMRSALLGRGHLRNVALALTYATAYGVDPDAASRVLGELRALPRRMERYTAGGRTVLDDTAAHPESFKATFAVMRMLPHTRLVVVYSIRGSRGAGLNAANASALGELIRGNAVDRFIVTAAVDATRRTDRVTPAELTAAHDALSAAQCPFIAHSSLRDAIADAVGHTESGDLLVLIGAQGMNEGRRMVEEAAG